MEPETENTMPPTGRLLIQETPGVWFVWTQGPTRGIGPDDEDGGWECQ